MTSQAPAKSRAAQRPPLVSASLMMVSMVSCCAGVMVLVGSLGLIDASGVRRCSGMMAISGTCLLLG